MGRSTTLSIPAVIIAAECYGVSIGIHCCPEDAAAVSTHLPLGCDPISPMDAAHRFIFEADPHIEGFFSVKRGLSAKAQAPAQPLEAALKIFRRNYTSALRNMQQVICLSMQVLSHGRIARLFCQASAMPANPRLYGLSFRPAQFIIRMSTPYSMNMAAFIPLRCQSVCDWMTGERRFIRPDNVASSPRKPDFIVFARYRSGATWRPQRLQPAAAVMQLIRHSIADTP